MDVVDSKIIERLLHLDERVARVDRSLRRWRLASLILGAGVLLIIVAGMTPSDGVPSVLEARELRIVNRSGALVARISGEESGGLIRLFNGVGGEVVTINVRKEGGGMLAVRNARLRDVLFAGDRGDGNGLISVGCDEGTKVFRVSVGAGRRGHLRLSDGDGDPIAFVGGDPENADVSRLDLFGVPWSRRASPDWKALSVTCHARNGNELRFHLRRGRSATMELTQTSEAHASLVLSDGRGTPRVRLLANPIPSGVVELVGLEGERRLHAR